MLTRGQYTAVLVGGGRVVAILLQASRVQTVNMIGDDDDAVGCWFAILEIERHEFDWDLTIYMPGVGIRRVADVTESEWKTTAYFLCAFGEAVKLALSRLNAPVPGADSVLPAPEPFREALLDAMSFCVEFNLFRGSMLLSKKRDQIATLPEDERTALCEELERRATARPRVGNTRR